MIMLTIHKYINKSIVRLASKEANPINQARVRMLIYTLFFYMLFAGVLIVYYLIATGTLYLLSMSIIFASCVFLFASVWYTLAWKLVSHISICLITFSGLTNIRFYGQGVSIRTVQFIWIATVLS